jgi:hypothetical protein
MGKPWETKQLDRAECDYANNGGIYCKLMLWGSMAFDSSIKTNRISIYTLSAIAPQ